MTRVRLALAFALALLLPSAAWTAPAKSSSAAAESLFLAGRLVEADRAFAATLASAPGDTLALVRRAAMALFDNRLSEARPLLREAARRGAAPRRVEALLAETWYRADQFDSAAVHFRRSGREGMAAKLESFHGRRPYRIAGPDADTVRFLQTDPLPTVELMVNGRGPFLFLIDTGGGELTLDPTFGDSVHAARYGAESGQFAGGKRRDVQHATADSVQIGRFVVDEVPLLLLDTSRLSGVVGGARVAGILGTTLLGRFRFTLDYRDGTLVLERRGATSPAPAPAGPHRAVVPFWLAGDHFMLARGTIGTSPEVTWFVDTGLAGAAFTGPASTLSLGGIALKDTASLTGEGGGGSVRVTPFLVPRITVGPVKRDSLLGMVGAFPPSLETSLGPRVAGLVSHAFFRESRVTFDLDRMQLTIDGGF
jgi:hypothetical protein